MKTQTHLMDYKKLIQALGFVPKENTTGIFIKTYEHNGEYALAVDFEKQSINYGKKITAESKTTQNHAQAENWVVLECVDRLLEKGYKPKNITLEKTWPTGHGTSGRLDVLVKNDKGATYLMIECKTWGAEYDKELKALNKNGGQLLTYFQQDKHAEVIMLYASALEGKEVKYKNHIIKIEDHYRDAGNVPDVYERWNKITLENGIFDDWVAPYCFENKRITKIALKPLDKEASTALFHNFLSILRKHSVSDKGNAFNVIFDLFLAKLWDEKKENPEEMDFQWRENEDDPVTFQYRLLDLYKEGMNDFLRKEVFGIKDSDLNASTPEEIKTIKKKILMLDKVFSIKGVIDEESFEENHRVLKEVVELLQQYRIRYPRKQQHLSDFFERLLTTGLKQEAGQFFTPPPITRFIVRSLPVKEVLSDHINRKSPTLPAVIDYAVGSGHFLTEIMEEYQATINKLDTTTFKTDAKKKVKAWKADEYDWAAQYVYGVDVDYRLVKVAKVGCYFYGDGLAQVIHGNGLDSFKNSKAYRGLLKDNTNKPQFQFVLSNPPYSVSSFKTTLRAIDAEQDFKLYNRLTDRSSEIECLFIERTAHLLKTGGIAALVLPSSILSNTGVYTDARDIILRDFDIIAITELGSGTFMATGTNTVVLFLQRRDDQLAIDVQASVATAIADKKDNTIKGIEKPISQYLAHLWEGIKWSDYKTLLNGKPNQAIQDHELYIEYTKKIKGKTEEQQAKIIALEAEKLTYFILAYGQEVVLVKTGDKKKEKKFLGYEFSNRRGSEGMHPINRSQTIDQCTQLYDPAIYDNPSKASTYIHNAFANGKALPIPTELKDNISYQALVDMMTFDRSDFEKNISLSVKKKVKYKEVWNTDKLVVLGSIAEIKKGKTITEAKAVTGSIPVIAGGKSPAYYHNVSNRAANIITVSASGANAGFVNHFNVPIFASDCNTIKSLDESVISTELIFSFLTAIQPILYSLQRGQAQPHVYADDLSLIQIPLPPKNIQEKIVKEIEAIDKQEQLTIDTIEKAKEEINVVINKSSGVPTRLSDITSKIGSGATPRGGEGVYKESGITLIRSQNIYDHGFVEKGLAFIDDKQAKKLDGVTVKSNDILFNITGASIARCCIVEDKYLPARVNQHVAIIRTTEKALPKYVQMILVSEQYKNELLEIGEGATSRQALNKQQLEDFKIPLPPLAEQKKIVQAIEKIEAKITTLQTQLSNIPASKEAVLKKYL